MAGNKVPAQTTNTLEGGKEAFAAGYAVMTKASRNGDFADLSGRCGTVVQLLPWFLNGTLDNDERDIVTSHLSVCEACRDEMKETRDHARLLDTHVPSLELAALAHGLLPTAAVNSKISAHLEMCSSCADELAMLVEAGRGQGILNARPWPRWAVAAAAVVGVGLAVGITQKAHIEGLKSRRAQSAETKVPTALSEVGSSAEETAQLFFDGFESGDSESWNGKQDLKVN